MLGLDLFAAIQVGHGSGYLQNAVVASGRKAHSIKGIFHKLCAFIGQIAVAEFANASGLQKEGENLYSQTNNSGEFNGIGIDISSNGDAMTTGTLEMSNVDLSSEFTEMITTQRGYQANSRIITVSDTLLEELVNLKR